MQDHENLFVWRSARLLVAEIYGASARLPIAERFGLQSQVRRAAVSIATNIAEGCSRATSRDFARFLQVALGSANEVLCLLDLGLDLGYLETPEHERLRTKTQSIRRMLIALIASVRTRWR